MKWVKMMLLRIYLFHDGGHYIETNGFYMITASVMKELRKQLEETFYSGFCFEK